MSQVTPLPEDSSARSGWRWFPLNVGTALALAVVVSLLAFMLTSNGDATVAAADADIAQSADGSGGESAASADESAASADGPATLAEAAPATATAEAGNPERGDESAVETAPPSTVAAAKSLRGGDSASFSVLAMGGDITNMGSTEIGFVTNFPSLEYSWERIELSVDGMVDIGWLGELNGSLVAVSPSWDEFEGSGQALVTAVSADGVSWEAVGSFDLPTDAWVSRVVSDGERLFAFAETWSENGTNEHIFYVSDDGVDWSSAAIDLQPEPDEHVYIQNAEAGPAGLVVAVSYESSPEQQPQVLEFESLQVQIDHMRGTYTVADIDSGDVLLEGSTDELFNWGGEGQSIYDPETGELLTTIPWEVWERAYGLFYEGGYPGGTPLPIPVYTEEPPATGVITVEHDGLVVTVNEYGGTYAVTDAESGDEIASGTLDYLYQGPPPRFVDESGDVLLEVTWDEWYQAEEQSYMHMEAEYYDYRSRTALLTSVDGATWQSEPIPNRNGAHVAYLVATDDGFVAMVNAYGEYGDHPSVWSFNGTQWDSIETEYSDLWLYQVATTTDGLLGVGEGPGGPALWSSTDGIEWISEFAVVPQDDGSYVSLADVAADASGTVGVLSRKEKWSDYRPLVIEQDGYTLTFEDGETVLRVTDGTGETVLALGWESFEQDGGSDVVTWDEGTTYINLDNRDVIAIADEDAHAAMESRYDEQGQLGLSVFIKDRGQWAEAIVDVAGGLSGASQLSMVDGKIIIGGTYWENVERYRSDIPAGSSFVIIVGTPIGG